MTKSGNEIMLLPELIETLWNVKKELMAVSGQVVGINRNIVECKVF